MVPPGELFFFLDVRVLVLLLLFLELVVVDGLLSGLLLVLLLLELVVLSNHGHHSVRLLRRLEHVVGERELVAALRELVVAQHLELLLVALHCKVLLLVVLLLEGLLATQLRSLGWSTADRRQEAGRGGFRAEGAPAHAGREAVLQDLQRERPPLQVLLVGELSDPLDGMLSPDVLVAGEPVQEVLVDEAVERRARLLLLDLLDQLSVGAHVAQMPEVVHRREDAEEHRGFLQVFLESGGRDSKHAAEQEQTKRGTVVVEELADVPGSGVELREVNLQ